MKQILSRLFIIVATSCMIFSGWVASQEQTIEPTVTQFLQDSSEPTNVTRIEVDNSLLLSLANGRTLTTSGTPVLTFSKCPYPQWGSQLYGDNNYCAAIAAALPCSAGISMPSCSSPKSWKAVWNQSLCGSLVCCCACQ